MLPLNQQTLRKSTTISETPEEFVQSEEAKRLKADQGFFTGLGLAVQKDNTIWSVGKAMLQDDRGAHNRNYKPSEVVQKAIVNAGMNTKDADELISDAGNDDQALELIRRRDGDIQLNKDLDALGWTGTAARLLANVLEPTNYVAVGAAARFGRIARSAASGAVSAGVGETILMQNDTQRDYYDVALSMAAGTFFGAAFGSIGATRIKNKGDVLDATLYNEVTKSAKKVVEDPTVPKSDLAVKQQLASLEVDLANQTRKVEGLEGTIKSGLAGKEVLIKSKAEISNTKARILNIENHIEAVKKTDADINKIPVKELEVESAPRDDSVGYVYKGALPEDTPEPKPKKPKKDGEPTEKEVVQKEPRVTLEDVGSPEGESLPTEWKISPLDQAKVHRLTSFIKELPPTFGAQSFIGPLKLIKNQLQAGFTQVDHSGFSLQRALNVMFSDNPQGHNIASIKTPAAIKQHLNINRLNSKGSVPAYKDAFEKWSKIRGKGRFRAWMNFDNSKKEFDTEVYLGLHDPRRDMSPEVRQAVEGMGRGYAAAADMVTEAKVAGFKLMNQTGYVPLRYTSTKMLKALKEHGEALVEDLVTKAYMDGAYKLAEGTARKVAKMQIFRSRNNGLDNSVSRFVTTKQEMTDLIDKLEKAGVDSDTISSFLANEAEATVEAGVAGIGKLSLRANPSVELPGLKMTDLLDTNVDNIYAGYTREVAGVSALADMGFPSVADTMSTIDLAHKVTLAGIGDNPKKVKKLDHVTKELRGMINLISGKSVDIDPHSGTKKAMRLATDVTGTVKLQMLGFAQLTEPAKLLSQFGMVGTLKALPNLNLLVRSAQKEGGKLYGLPKNPEMREIFEHLGWVGEDAQMNFHNIRNQDAGDILEDTFSGRLGTILNNGLTMTAKATEIMSGFRHIQGGMEKIAMRGVKNTVIRMAEGKSNFLNKAFVQKDMIEVGWDRAFQKELFSWVKANPKTVEWAGAPVRLMNFEKMPSEMYTRLVEGMTRMSARLIQRNFVGESSVWMNTTIGKVLSQFRKFQLVSLEKQLIHDFKSEHIRNAQLMLWSATLGSMSYSATVYLNSLDKEDPEKYREIMLSPKKLALGAFNKASNLASLGLAVSGADLLLGFGDDTGRYGGKAVDENVPVISMANNIFEVPRAAYDAITDPSDAKLNNLIKRTKQVVPLARVPAAKLLLGATFGN